MAYVEVDFVNVFAWGQRVGAVALDPSTNVYLFEYDPAWQQRGIELAPTTMPLRQRMHSFPSLPETTYRRLPPLLADSLPDDFGTGLLNAELARQGIPVARVSSLDRLAYMANRGMGALEFKPTRGSRVAKPTAVEVSDLVTASRSALEGSFDQDKATQAAISQLIQVGTSAGGARAKAVIAWNPMTLEVQSGQVPARPGFEHWLLKLDSTGADATLGATANWGRTEYAYHLMALAAGVDMMPCRLLEENGRAHFMTRRFDRKGETKIHVSTLCALCELDFRQVRTHDYAQYFEAIDILGLGPDARAQAFRRMVFNVVAANCDDHTKNFSFVLPEGGHWQLSPAYDVTYAYLPGNHWIEAHLMSVTGKFDGIAAADLLELADRYEVPDPRGALNDVVAAVDSWPEFAAQARLPTERTVEITRTLARMEPT